MLCSEHSIVNHSPTGSVVAPLRCKCWTCEECQPLNRRRLIKRGIDGNPNTFITLTLRASNEISADEQARSIVTGFRDLRRRMLREAKRDPSKNPHPFVKGVDWSKRENRLGQVARQVQLDGDTMPFMVVIEKTQIGTPHLHILARTRWIDFKWLQAAWKDLTGAHIVNIKRVKRGMPVAAYVAKYVGKDPHRFDGCKRHWSSQDFLTPDQKEAERASGLDGPWWRLHEPMDQIVARAVADGWTATHGRFSTYLEPP